MEFYTIDGRYVVLNPDLFEAVEIGVPDHEDVATITCYRPPIPWEIPPGYIEPGIRYYRIDKEDYDRLMAEEDEDVSTND